MTKNRPVTKKKYIKKVGNKTKLNKNTKRIIKRDVITSNKKKMMKGGGVRKRIAQAFTWLFTNRQNNFNRFGQSVKKIASSYQTMFVRAEYENLKKVRNIIRRYHLLFLLLSELRAIETAKANGVQSVGTVKKSPINFNKIPNLPSVVTEQKKSFKLADGKEVTLDYDISYPKKLFCSMNKSKILLNLAKFYYKLLCGDFIYESSKPTDDTDSSSSSSDEPGVVHTIKQQSNTTNVMERLKYLLQFIDSLPPPQQESYGSKIKSLLEFTNATVTDDCDINFSKTHVTYISSVIGKMNDIIEQIEIVRLHPSITDANTNPYPRELLNSMSEQGLSSVIVGPPLDTGGVYSTLGNTMKKSDFNKVEYNRLQRNMVEYNSLQRNKTNSSMGQGLYANPLAHPEYVLNQGVRYDEDGHYVSIELTTNYLDVQPRPSKGIALTPDGDFFYNNTGRSGTPPPAYDIAEDNNNGQYNTVPNRSDEYMYMGAPFYTTNNSSGPSYAVPFNNPELPGQYVEPNASGHGNSVVYVSTGSSTSRGNHPAPPGYTQVKRP